MKLYFFRHAIAEEGEVDEKRELTPKGIERTRMSAHMLAALAVKPTRIYSSPLVRARQTAELLAPTLDTAVQVRDELRPGFDIEAAQRLLADLPDDEEVMLVGHEPDFSGVVSRIIGGGEIVMKKGGLARVDTDTIKPLRGKLIWLLGSKILASYTPPPPPPEPKLPKLPKLPKEDSPDE